MHYIPLTSVPIHQILFVLLSLSQSHTPFPYIVSNTVSVILLVSAWGSCHSGNIIYTLCVCVCVCVCVWFKYLSFFSSVARSIPLTVGLSFGSGVTMAIIKYRHGTYIPPIPLRGASIRHQERAWPTNESR